jgi:hypothetical protein
MVVHESFQYGLQGGKLVGINDVGSGLKCKCFCPSCGKPFVAYKGKVLKPHFKHLSQTSCKYSHETALHYLAKEIICEEGYLPIPYTEYRINNDLRSFYFQENQEVYAYSPQPDECKGVAKVYFDKVEVEKNEGNIKPDLKCIIKDTVLLVEIAVTHFVDEEKLSKVKERGIPLLELNLSGLERDITKKQLKSALYNSMYLFSWKNNPKGEKVKEDKYAEANLIRDFLGSHSELYVIDDGGLINDCPIIPKDEIGISFSKHCNSCRFFLCRTRFFNSIDGEHTSRVNCIGAKRQELDSLLNDLKLFNNNQ